MEKFKVIVLGVLGINNKVFKAGDIVQENNFPEGNAKKLVSDGKLAPIVSENKAEKETDEKGKKEASKKIEKKAEKEEAN